MTPQKPMHPGTPDEWLAHAASDLQYGNLGHRDPLVLPEHVCFHAQQAVEKAVKAVLRKRSCAFPPTHDLQTLLNLLKESGAPMPTGLADVESFTPFAVLTRYPSDWDPIEPHEVEVALRLAEKVWRWAESQVITNAGGLKDMPRKPTQPID